MLWYAFAAFPHSSSRRCRFGLQYCRSKRKRKNSSRSEGEGKNRSVTFTPQRENNYHEQPAATVRADLTTWDMYTWADNWEGVGSPWKASQCCLYTSLSLSLILSFWLELPHSTYCSKYMEMTEDKIKLFITSTVMPSCVGVYLHAKRGSIQINFPASSSFAFFLSD